MTAVLSIHTSDGNVGRCDGRCHEAETEECDCLCGGKFHGVGTKAALEGMGAMYDDLLKAMKPEHQGRLEIGQGKLFV